MTDEQKNKLLHIDYHEFQRYRSVMRRYSRDALMAWYAAPRPAEFADECARFEDELVSAFLGEPVNVRELPEDVAEKVKRAINAALNRYYFVR